jgi:2-dehydro-3-deoxygalactonokinase
MSDHALLALDWGTSSLRGARLDPRGQILEERSFQRGILTVEAGGFGAVFESLFGDWLPGTGGLCLISGMAGSRQGWLEAPYCACPAGFDDLGRHLAWVEPGPLPRRIAIVPGLSCLNEGIPDVMRGEEVQIFGAMQLAGVQDGLFVLPGTHSKWATSVRARIECWLSKA